MKAGLRLNLPDKKIANIEVKKFYKNDDLNLQEYPNETIKRVYDINSKRTHTNQHINVSNLKDEKIKQEMKDFLEILIFNYKDDIQKFFDEGKLTVANNMKLKTFRIRLVNLQNTIDFLETKKLNSIFDIDIIQLRKDFKSYIESKKLNVNNNVSLIEQMYTCLMMFYDKNEGLEKDVWILGQNLNIGENRINKTSSDKMIDFRDIKNNENKETLKEYGKYLIELTDLSFSTIYSHIYDIKDFVLFLNEINLYNISRENIENYKIANEGKDYLPYKLSKTKVFYEWAALNEKISEIFIYQTDIVYNHKHKQTAVDNYVIRQIFNNLDKIPEYFRLMYLISYSCGMRISEICLLKKDLLYKENNGYFIKYFSQKMQKEVTNPICETLYKMLDQYIKTLPKNSDYLFNAPKKENYPCSTKYFSDNFKRALKLLNIKNPDGTPYEFKNHSYRHTLATNMVELDIPIEIIQKVLHHATPEMTLSYAEVRDSHKIKKFKEFINIKGELAPLEEFKEIEDELITAEWIRQNINAQILPNGYCGMPIKLGKCPHANSCLECEDFRTSKDFLPQHKQQLEKTKQLIDICKENNWLPQLETNIRIKEVLEKLIKRLEKE